MFLSTYRDMGLLISNSGECKEKLFIMLGLISIKKSCVTVLSYISSIKCEYYNWEWRISYVNLLSYTVLGG